MSKAGGAMRGLTWTGILLILIVGAIHAIESPDYFSEATYIGWLFVANAFGAVVAAFGIYRGAGWGWGLSLLISAGAFVAYIVSRTAGLPGAMGLSQESFFETSGLISLIIEALFVISFIVWTSRRANS